MKIRKFVKAKVTGEQWKVNALSLHLRSNNTHLSPMANDSPVYPAVLSNTAI